MSLRKIFSVAVPALGLVLACGASALAQQQQPQSGGDSQQRTERGERRRGGGGGPRGEGFGMMRGLRELNLTEAQQQQARAIFERFNANTKPQREQLMKLREQFEAGDAPADAQEQVKTLRAQIRESEKAAHQELLGILTPEQRTQLEQMEKERKARREEMRQRREGNQPPTQ